RVVHGEDATERIDDVVRREDVTAVELDVRSDREGVVLPIGRDASVRGGRDLHRETRDEDGDVLTPRFIPNEGLVHVLEDLDAGGLDVRGRIEGIRFSEGRRCEDSRM